MKKAFEVPNFRVIRVSFLGATNNSGSRIKLSEVKRYNDDKTKSKIFSYDYRIGDTMEQAFEILVRNGWNIVCRASDNDAYMFLCDNWAEDFKKIEDLKQYSFMPLRD